VPPLDYIGSAPAPHPWGESCYEAGKKLKLLLYFNLNNLLLHMILPFDLGRLLVYTLLNLCIHSFILEEFTLLPLI
jgi:hypothetical protein